MKKISHSRSGIALFILLTSLVILSLAMRELILITSLQADRVRYQYDRMRAIYLARSTLNLSRFFLIYDLKIDTKVLKDQASDGPNDLWAKPLPFPLPIEMVYAMTGKLAEGAGLKEKSGDSSSQKSDGTKPDEDLLKHCREFFDDFPGNAESQTTDLAGKINLNDLDKPDIFQTFLELLQANPDFLQSLTAKGLNPESLAREIRDYKDNDDVESETNAPEADVYRSANLDYGPKNKPFTNLDELKMIPSVDDEIFEYLLPFISASWIALRPSPAKINLNTVSKEVFQALLKNVGDPQAIADKFIKDRAEKKRNYTEKTAAKMLEDNLGLTTNEIRVPLLTGISNAFHIETKANVNQVEVTLDTIMGRGMKKPFDPIVSLRISP
jgi:type II secretory pathway component PulK